MKLNIIANFFGRLWGIASNFFFIPLYIHYLGFDSYSVISFTLVIAGLMAVLDAGLTATLSRELARKDVCKEDKYQIFKTLESSYFVVVVLCVFIVFSLSSVIAEKWLNLNTFNPDQVSYFIKIMSFDIAFQLLLRFYLGGMLGIEKQVKANLYQVGWGVLRNGMVLIIIMFSPSLESFFYWQVFSTIFVTLLLKLSVEKELVGSYVFIFFSKIDRKIFKKVWRFAMGMMLISFISALNTQMDKILISKLLPISSLGHYMLAVSVATGILVLVSPIATAVLPRFTAQYSSGKNNEAILLFSKASTFVSIVVFAVMSNMIFFSKEILWAWTGDMDLSIQASLALPYLAIAMSMLALQFLPFHIAIANGYTKLNNQMGILTLIFIIPIHWILSPRWGVIGAALTFLITQLLSWFIYVYYINKKFLKVKISDIYLKQMLVPLVLTIVITYLFSLIPVFYQNSRVFTICWISISIIVTLFISVIILFPIKKLKYLLLNEGYKN